MLGITHTHIYTNVSVHVFGHRVSFQSFQELRELSPLCSPSAAQCSPSAAQGSPRARPGPPRARPEPAQNGPGLAQGSHSAAPGAGHAPMCALSAAQNLLVAACARSEPARDRRARWLGFASAFEFALRRNCSINRSLVAQRHRSLTLCIP